MGSHRITFSDSVSAKDLAGEARKTKRASENALLVFIQRTSTRTEGPVVPVVPGLVPVDVGKTAVVRVTAVQTVRTVLKFACFHL